MHIGIAGVGRMGSNMTLRLMEGGHKLTVWNRSTDKLKPLQDAGASVAKTPAELASAVEAILTIVTNADAIDTVYHGKDGLLSGDVKGKVFMEMSTVPPTGHSTKAAPFARTFSASFGATSGGTVLISMNTLPFTSADRRPSLPW